MTRLTPKILTIATLISLSHLAPASSLPQFDPNYFTQGQYQGHAWVSGGIGTHEREQLSKHFGQEYNLKLEFARVNGHYLGDVAVTITDPGGDPVLSAPSPGPWFLAKLPAGEYRVIASADERTFERPVSIPEQGSRTLVFNAWRRGE
ncbi:MULTISPECIES: hypothetical protein [Thiorhodovibrio]|uniref:hypothetical protein n=1 Tax=Thiorhodovibrio TaxID=61593 RepID=UPI00191317E6|nr:MULTISPECIES: hypothetical protein [Thiorhodovibrio]MBK5969146.1 hypothetical protein [Thiorhodovibrio winogradskyi]WPL13381.1 hypothetical protein Thiosp_03182 [Thiorhodovibrio litoralis]